MRERKKGRRRQTRKKMNYFKAQKDLHIEVGCLCEEDFVCVDQLFKNRVYCHSLKILPLVFLGANHFLFNITWKAHRSPIKMLNKLSAVFSSPVPLNIQSGFSPYPSLLQEEHLCNRGSETTRWCKRWAQGHPQPSFPSQLLFTSASTALPLI